MGELRVQQLLHGYKNGHELLASSVKLMPKDAELTARLSDLSGTLQSGTLVYPYLTVYPLPSRKYYAVARTWLDRGAPRSGCVLTHTILVSMEDWSSGTVGIDEVVDHLRMPAREKVLPYREAIVIESGCGPSATMSQVPLSEIEEFAAKYFGEGIRPIVWLRENDPVALFISIVRHLWPSLRETFAACTLSLQPRTLAAGPFDLLFAPISAYSRFSKVPRENLIESGRALRPSQKPEPWISALAKTIADSSPLPVPFEWQGLYAALGADPTAVRWLYLLNDLKVRSFESPMAALGIMDIIATLCPGPEEKIALKEEMICSALQLGHRIPETDGVLTYLQLMCERLTHPPFRGVGRGVLTEISQRVASASAHDIDGALMRYEALQNRSHDNSNSLRTFRDGVREALISASALNTESLDILRDHPLAAREIVSESTVLTEQYLRRGKAMGFNAGEDVAAWLGQSNVAGDWLALSRLALDLAPFAGDDQLINEAFSHLNAQEAAELLKGIDSTRLAEASMVEAVEQLTSLQPLVVRQWAVTSSDESSAAADIAATTFEFSTDGLNELVSDGALTLASRNAVFAAFVLRSTDRIVPKWMSAFVDQSPSLLVDLVSATNDDSLSGERALVKLLPALGPAAPDVLPRLVGSVDRVKSSNLVGLLCSFIVKSALIRTLRGEFEESAFEHLAVSTRLSEWLQGIDGAWLAGVISAAVGDEVSATIRAWSWLASAPASIYKSRSHATLAVISLLQRRSRHAWSNGASEAWGVVIERAAKLCDARIALRHSVYALEFALGNSKLPLSPIVRFAFPIVYKAVVSQSEVADEAERLFSYEWDKGKALRRNLIEAYYYTSWPPGDLAIIAENSFGLGKLFKRLWRKWSGEQYIERMISDLDSRSSNRAEACKSKLASFLANPDFYEPWD